MTRFLDDHSPSAFCSRYKCLLIRTFLGKIWLALRILSVPDVYHSWGPFSRFPFSGIPVQSVLRGKGGWRSVGPAKSVWCGVWPCEFGLNVHPTFIGTWPACPKFVDSDRRTVHQCWRCLGILWATHYHWIFRFFAPFHLVILGVPLFVV